MNLNPIIITALAALAGIISSCSPVKGVYLYKGRVNSTGTSRSDRELILTEYQDGVVSGELKIPNSSRSNQYSTGDIGGKITGNDISFSITSLGNSYVSAKMASINANPNSTPCYIGTITKNRSKLDGNWVSNVNGYRRKGSFSFRLTEKNGEPWPPKPKVGVPGGTGGGVTPGGGDEPDFYVE